jgi:hypothetical protein
LLGLLLWPYVEARQLPFVGTPPSFAPPYLNPLHEDGTKWKMAQGLRSAILRSGLPANCKITIFRLQVPYAEDYAADFKEILDVIGWKYDEQFATRSVERGISIRALNVPGPSKDCAETLDHAIFSWTRARNGHPLSGTHLQWLVENEASDYLRNCPSGCVEVDFGNEDTSR